MLLANGTFLAVTPATNPHLFRALATSVGRLGVVTELVMRIRPQMAVTKSLQVCGRSLCAWAGAGAAAPGHGTGAPHQLPAHPAC